MRDASSKHAWSLGRAPEGPYVSPSTSTTAKVLLTTWLLVLAAAFVGLWHYKLTPGNGATLEPLWPAQSNVVRVGGRPTLLLFAHPRCPCTRASLAELRTVMSPLAGKLTAEVLFFDAGASLGADFTRTDAWQLASSIPGVRVAADSDGREAHRFGATTSGHVVLYDASGRLEFSGGITPARGHEGESPQLRHLMALLAHDTERPPTLANPTDVALGAVYGCGLRDRR